MTHQLNGVNSNYLQLIHFHILELYFKREKSNMKSVKWNGENLLLGTLLFILVNGSAQPNISINDSSKYRAVHWGLEHGLVSGVVYFMLKDINGFLWIGTQNGLGRFDGSTFKNYYNDPTKSGTYKAETADLGMLEDSMHNIWIGSYNGLFRYDIKADTFLCFNNNMLQFQNGRFSIFGNYVVEIFWATEDEIYGLENRKILVSYNVHNFKRKELITLSEEDSVGEGTSASYSYYDQASNSIWMIRGCCGSRGGPPGGGLLHVSLNSKEKKYYSWPCFKNIPNHNHFAESMKYDRLRNCLWINSWEGLMQFTLEDKQFHYLHVIDKLFKLKDYGHASGMCIDLQGRIWFATQPKGIVIYDPSNQNWEFPFPNDSTLQQEISYRNVDIYCDRDGIIWIGFWQRKGIFQLIPYAPSVKHYKTDFLDKQENASINVVNFQKAKHSELWLGTSNGLYSINQYTNKVINYSPSDLGIKSSNTPYNEGKTIFCDLVDTINNKIWIYRRPEGFYVMDIDSKICKPYTFLDRSGVKVKISDRVAVARFKNDLILNVANKEKQWIFQLNTKTEIANELFKYPQNGDRVWQTFAFDNGYLFVGRNGSLGNLTYKYTNEQWTQIITPFDSLQWRLITYTKKDSSFWVLVGRRLLQYNSNFKLLRTFTPDDGLPDISIYNLQPDLKDNIWFNTDRSIYQLNTETGVISKLSEKDGFISFGGFSNGIKSYLMNNGDIYFAGTFNAGFLRVTPDKYSNSPTSSYIQAIEINQRPYPFIEGVNNIRELHLKYNQNQITIETGVIDYYSKGTSHIRYKLNTGLWQYGPARYTIRYEELPPGDYTLHLQSSNAANEFIGPIKSLRITISPPWWKTWGAYTFFSILVLMAVSLFIQYQSTNLRKRNLMLEDKVEK
ncbi:MAG: hypothetical protein ABI761_20175, partial [Saprospiraceae bacterium]